MEEHLNLVLLSEKALPQAANPQLIAYCPSMDLVALGSTDRQVLIYRLNGHRVYGVTQKSSTLQVERIRWKPNGQLLAIAWNDGTVRLVGAESSKIVHQFSTSDHAAEVTCVGWSSNITIKKPSSFSSKRRLESWEDLLAEDPTSEVRIPLDLPRDLALLDIEISLPKLSVLAAGGSSEDIFCSRTSLDALFTPFNPQDNNSVDVMVVGMKDGNIHLSIYDSFVVGSFASPAILSDVPSHLILHAAHEQYSTHALLMKSSDLEASLYFVPMDLRFIAATSDYLSLLASRSTAFQNLLRYIHEVQLLMVNEWKGTQELPGKFLRNINETLAEDNGRDIVQALYHSVATGHTFPSVREWLVDELTERGHKRWDKAVTTGLESLRRLVHENLLPALDRCSVILSRLTGIAKFQGSNDTLGFSSQQISLIVDTVACLHLVSSKILILVVDELDLFASFSIWLRYEIDRLASEATASPTDDGADKEASIDHSKVLMYIQTYMMNSPLTTFFGDAPSDDSKNDWAHFEQGLPMFDLLDKQLQKQEQSLPYNKALPRVELLCKYLSRQANAVFGQIAEAERRNVMFGKATKFGAAHHDSPLDMRMNTMNNSFCHTYVVFVPQGLQNGVQLFRVPFSIENGISTVHRTDTCVLQLGNGRIKDMKFFNSSILLVLWEADGVTSLLKIPYQTPHRKEGDLDFDEIEYSPHNQNAELPTPTLFSNEEVLRRFSNHRIPNTSSFLPDRMEIREPNIRSAEADMRRIVLLGKDRLHYKVFKFEDSNPGKREEDVSMS